MINCSFCLDLAAFRLSPYIKPVNGVYPLERRTILKRGGAYRAKKDNRSLTVLSSLEGLPDLAELDYMVITTLEACIGTEDIPADPEMATLYNEIYDQTPIEINTPEGIVIYTPPRIFAAPSGEPIDHLNG